VPRTRLIRQKLITAAIFSTAALIFLPAWSLLVGGIAYGFGPYIGPTGEQIGWPAFAGRLVIIVIYLLLSQLVVAALAFAFGVWTDAPLGAVGGAVVIMIVMAILDTISALGDLRQALPGHYAYAWADALSARIDPSDMINGVLWSVGYAVVVTSAAVWHFLRKDITS
jgi:ABC-2 type transport system permease protein